MFPYFRCQNAIQEKSLHVNILYLPCDLPDPVRGAECGGDGPDPVHPEHWRAVQRHAHRRDIQTSRFICKEISTTSETVSEETSDALKAGKVETTFAKFY